MTPYYKLKYVPPTTGTWLGRYVGDDDGIRLFSLRDAEDYQRRAATVGDFTEIECDNEAAVVEILNRSNTPND